MAGVFSLSNGGMRARPMTGGQLNLRGLAGKSRRVLCELVKLGQPVPYAKDAKV